MTSNHYVIKLEQELQCKEVATIEKDHHKQMMIESKDSLTNEKVGRKLAKHHHFNERAMKK
jgi:hypothetical protein